MEFSGECKSNFRQTPESARSMKFLRLQEILLHLIGYSVRPNEPVIWKLGSHLGLYLLTTHLFPESYYIYDNLSDIKKTTDGLCPCLFGLSTIIKMFTLLLRRSRFYAVIWKIKDLTNSVAQDYRPILDRAYTISNRLSLPHIVSTIMVGVLYIVFPIAMGTFGYFKYGKGSWEMPMRAKFPYDVNVSPYYELSYCSFTFATFFAAFGAAAIDTLFYASSFNLSAHFTVIQTRFETLQYDRINSEMKRKSQAAKDLRQVIQYHERVIKLTNELCDTYEPILFAQFLISSMQICVIAFQLTLDKLTVQAFLTYTTFLLAISFQCFLYCNGGTKLETESSAVANALYAGNWYSADVRVQRMLRVCMQRAQKPIVVKSVFFAANLSTFSSIMSSAGSYITLLQTVK